MKQIQSFFQQCNLRLKRKDDSISRGQKVYNAVHKLQQQQQSNSNKNDVDDVDSFVDGVYLACWLRNRFSSTPAVLDSFYQVALSL